MYYTIKVQGHVRVDPKLFSLTVEKEIKASLQGKFEGYISKDLGVVIGVNSVDQVGEGVIISGDGAAYYSTTFSVLSFKPEVGEVILGKISDINDFVSFSKSNILTGKETKRNLKVGDLCRARIIAVSYKDVSNPKIGLTMRQHRLGALSWIEEDMKKESKKGKKE